MTASFDVTTTEQQGTLETPQDIKFPETPVGILMAGLGFDKEALRLESCGVVRMRKCENHHVDRRERRYCMNRFACEPCNERWVEGILERWQLWLDYFKTLADKEYFTYLELRVPMNRTIEDIKRFLDSIDVRLWSAGHACHFDRIFPFEGNDFILHLLLPDTTDDGSEERDKWAGMFPEASSIIVRTAQNWQLPYFFKNRLLTARVPDTDREKADQWKLFRGMHLFRACGAHTQDSKNDEKDFFVENGDTTKKSPESDLQAPNRPANFTTCLTCGKPLTYRTVGFVSEFAPPQLQKWEEIPTDSPPT